MEQINFSALLSFAKFRSRLSLLLGQIPPQDVEEAQQEALTFLTYLQTLQVSELSMFMEGNWDFNADYPNASRFIRGSKLRIDFTKYPNIPDLAMLELKAAFMLHLKALSGIPAEGDSINVSQKLSKPNTVISRFESGMRFLDKVFSVANEELGKEHVEREMASVQSLPAHFYDSAAEKFDYVFDNSLITFFQYLRSGYLQENVFGSNLPIIDLAKLAWKSVGATHLPAEEVKKKKQVLTNEVFEISSLAASLAIVDFLDVMGEEVVDTGSLNRRNAKNYFAAKDHGLCPLMFNLYIYKRLTSKGFSSTEVAKVIRADTMASSEYFKVTGAYATRLYTEETGSRFDEKFRRYINFLNYSCMYVIGQYTGMRPSEYAELLASSCLRYDGQYWLLRSNVSKHQDNLVELFDDFWLAIPIVRDAVRVCQLLSRYKNNDFIFSNVDTVPFGKKEQPFSTGGTKLTLDKFFQTVLSPGQFSKLEFNAYMMRHTLAYQLYRADVGLPFISHQLKHFGDIVGVGHSDRGFSKTTLAYGEIGDMLSKGGNKNAIGKSFRRQAEVESIRQRFDPDGNYAGVNAAAHKETLWKAFRGYMASGYTKDDIFEAMAEQHIAVINVGQGFCYGGAPSEFDSSIPCIGGLRCNPNRCSNAIVSKANAPSWREVYYQNKAMLGNPEYSHTHAQNKVAMEEAFGVLQLLGEEL